ncbi:MAG: extracellular solute-binding protein [Solobacterium sp.]|nr:extracellular solute-binding protein [Solobacterium sp.]
MQKSIRTSMTLLAAAVCLTGCMSKPSAPAADESARVEPPADIWAPYSETVTVTTMGEENSGTEFQGDDDYGNNPWYRAYKERFNINLVNKWISNDYGTKLNLAIADKDIADVFYVDSARLTTLYEAGLIMNLDEVFDSYASDVLKQYRKDYADTWETGEFDGHLYGMPQMSYGIIDQFQYIWIRQDWMQECGFEEPKTMDDVITIATTFAEKYGGYALPECQTLENLYRLALSWGAHPGIWVKQADGTLGYGTIQPEMKEALAQYAEWYKEGIVNPNFTTLNWDKMMQGMINGECGVIPFAQWFGYNPLPDLIKNQGADAIFYPYEIPTQDGSPIKGSVTFNNNGYVVIRKDCPNPEAIMKIVNFYVYTVNDAVGKETNEYLSSLHSFNYPNCVRGTRIINPMNDYNQYLQVKDAFDRWQAGEDVDTSSLGTNVSKFESCVNWVTSQDPNGVGDFLQQGNDRSAYGIAKKYVDEEQYVQDAKWGPDTPTLQAAGSTLNDILIEGFTKIIIGEEPIDYFDELVEQWKTAGGAKATEEINETYGG